MISKRRFVQQATCLASSLSISLAMAAPQRKERASDWFMPDEAERHTRTWMAFGASEKVWGRKLLPEVRRNLATLAKTIARYEPVTMLARPSEMKFARSLVGTSVELIACELDDLWITRYRPDFSADRKRR